MPVVTTVRPVESAGSSVAIQVKAFDSPKVPTKKKPFNVQISDPARTEDIVESNKLQKLDMRNTGRKKVCCKKNVARIDKTIN